MAELSEAFEEYLEDGSGKGNNTPKEPKGPKPLKPSHPGDGRRGQHGGVDRSRRRRHYNNRHCGPGQVFENGVCMQKIGYGHHRRGYRRPPYRRGYIYDIPRVYSDPVVYREPVVYTRTVTGTTVPSSDSFWDIYGNYILIVIFLILIIFVVLMMSNFTR